MNNKKIIALTAVAVFVATFAYADRDMYESEEHMLNNAPAKFKMMKKKMERMENEGAERPDVMPAIAPAPYDGVEAQMKRERFEKANKERLEHMKARGEFEMQEGEEDKFEKFKKRYMDKARSAGNKMEEKIEKADKRIRAKYKELDDKYKKVRNNVNIKKLDKEKLVKALRKRVDYVSKKFERVFKRLDAIVALISKRLDKMQGEGMDVSEAKDKLAKVKEKYEATKMSFFKTKEELKREVENQDDFVVLVRESKASYKKIVGELKELRKELKDVVASMKEIIKEYRESKKNLSPESVEQSN